MSGNCFLPHPSFTGEKRVVVDGSGENAEKVSCGVDHQRWPNRYFKKLGLFCLLDARETEIASLRNGVNH
jgi:hypothetical protein